MQSHFVAKKQAKSQRIFKYCGMKNPTTSMRFRKSQPDLIHSDMNTFSYKSISFVPQFIAFINFLKNYLVCPL